MSSIFDVTATNLGYRARESLHKKYLQEHRDKELYERTYNKRNLTAYARKGIGLILKELQNPNLAPHATGLGISIGIRYKQGLTQIQRGKYIKAPNVFYIIIGSENPAIAGQVTPNAPYMAWHNTPRYKDARTGNIMKGGSYEGWIQQGLSNARRALKSYILQVNISNPVKISNYITKHGGARGISGYEIKVEFKPRY